MGSKIMSVMTVVHVSETVGSLAIMVLNRQYLSRPVTVLVLRQALSKNSNFDILHPPSKNLGTRTKNQTRNTL